MNIHIQTERLILRDIEQEDVEGMFRLDSDPEVHSYLGNQPISTREEAAEVIRYIRSQYDEFGIGRWAVQSRDSGEFLGWAGFKWITEDWGGYTNFHDIGYRLRKEHWGKGYASEAAFALIKFGFDKLRFEEIMAGADIENKASNRILQKIGMDLIDQFTYDGCLHNLYAIKAKASL